MRRLACCFVCVALAGCWSSSGRDEVVVYTALDSEFAEPIFRDFTKATKIEILSKFDTESTKTVGLTTALIAEAKRPRCDVFWNNEILNTIRLEKRGLLDAYRSPAANGFPPQYRSPAGTWHGFAARARVLIVNAKAMPAEERPKSIYDMTNEKWQGKIGIAKPLFGTTATHVACLFAYLGDEKARQFCRDLKANDVQILASNSQVARAAAAGQIAFGLTDTDDAIGMLERGHEVTIVYPDREPDQMGTLFIPNTVSIIKGCPHPAEARRLVDFLLSPQVEKALAVGPSAQIPLNSAVQITPRVETPRTVKAMPVDFAAAAELWETVARFVRDEFLGD